MDVRCDKCQARYRIDDARIGPQGLAVRCGKCGHAFRAKLDAAVVAPTPAVAAAAEAAAGPAGKGTASAARTMLFAPPPPTPAQKPGESRAGTVAPVARPPGAPGGTVLFAAASGAPAMAPPKPARDARSTVLFGGTPPAAGKDVAAGPAIPTGAFTAPPAPIPTTAERAAPTIAESSIPIVAQEPAPTAAGASSAAAARGLVAAEQEAQVSRRGLPRAAIVAVASALAVVLVLAGVVAARKLGRRAPPRAAIEQLAEAQALADKDAVASLGEAEAQANAALVTAVDARFPQAHATLAEIQVAWADALADQAWFWGDAANRAGVQGDDRKKGEAEAKAIALQDASKSRLKAAFEAALAGNKLDAKSPEVALALADYYRAARSRVNLGRELKRAAELDADPGKLAFIEGADFAARDDGGPKAVEKLKLALASAPRSARIHFRLAMAYLAVHQDSDARKELLETLRLSPQHERARLMLGFLAAPAAAQGASPTEGNTR